MHALLIVYFSGCSLMSPENKTVVLSRLFSQKANISHCMISADCTYNNLIKSTRLQLGVIYIINVNISIYDIAKD